MVKSKQQDDIKLIKKKQYDLDENNYQMDLSGFSLDSDFSTNINAVNFYMREEIIDFAKIQITDSFQLCFKDHIVVCCKHMTSSIYHFILPLRALYLQNIQPISICN